KRSWSCRSRRGEGGRVWRINWACRKWPGCPIPLSLSLPLSNAKLGMAHSIATAKALHMFVGLAGLRESLPQELIMRMFYPDMDKMTFVQIALLECILQEQVGAIQR